MTQVLLVRHGESEWNAAGRWQGQADPPLTDLGRRQAGIAARGAGEVDAVVSSDLVRASETARIIAEVLGIEGPVATDPGLRERDVGEWSGLTRAEIEERWGAPVEALLPPGPPGFEPLDALLRRVLAALDRIAHAHPGRRVLAVSHGGVIRSLERHLGTVPEPIPNLGGVLVSLDGDALSVGRRLLLLDAGDVPVTVPRQL